MKYILGILAFWLGFGAMASACDVCGCAATGGYSGILPQYQKHFVGLRWNSRSFKTRYIPSILSDGPTGSSDLFRTTELWGRYFIHPRFQVLGFVPYNQNRIQERDDVTQTSGLGDMSFIANYSVLDFGDSASGSFRQTLVLGAGAKFPTGRFDHEREGERLGVTLQSGTGTLDFLFRTAYTARLGKAGFNTTATWQLNGENRYDYQFGNRLSVAGRLFWWQKVGKVNLLPNAGISYERAGRDIEGQYYVPFSGGKIWMGTLGTDLYLGRYTLGGTWLLPIEQELGDGYITAQQQVQLQFTYLF